ncbi:phosphatase PAP2 family protein [Streptomyces sp. NPDC058579]|uniref:phosphatase PAP2 family protein n=1 Tax=Streptomyces sp. NPDC058579 TaxID=3346548 RepID=UPI003650A5DD
MSAVSVAPQAATGHRPSVPAPPRAGTLHLGICFLLVTALLGIAVLRHPERPPFQGVDEHWLTWMSGPHGGVQAALAAVLNWFGGPLGVVVPVGLLIFLIVRKRWWSVSYLLTSYLVGSMAVVQVLKHLVDRPRPENPMVRVDHGSFPSGHAAGAALLVVIVGALLVPAARRRAWWISGALFTLAMMWSRTWLHAHWLSDTVAGASVGAGGGLVFWWLFRRGLAREGSVSRD